VEDGLIVDYEVEVISMPLAFYSLISKLQPETTHSIDTTTTLEVNNAHKPTIPEYAAALLFEEKIESSIRSRACSTEKTSTWPG
jgi:hypothetical protein